MAAKACSNVFKRGKELVRLVVSKSTPSSHTRTFEVKQPEPGVEYLRFQSSQASTPLRNLLFTSRVSYRTIASQLRRRAAFEFGRKRQIPFFAFVGLTLASTTKQEEENENLSSDIRDVLQSQIKTSPIIQQLSLQSFDFGQMIGKGCNAVVYEARFKGGEANLDDSTDCEDGNDKWFPPIEEEKIETCSNSERETTDNSSPSFVESDEQESFCILSDETGSVSSCSMLDNSAGEITACDFMSISPPVSDIGFHGNTTEDGRAETDDESDKWSYFEAEMDTEGSLEEETTMKYDLAVKMMFNYEVESKADSIMRAMEKETVPARVPVYTVEDSWYTGNRVKLKSLPQHANVVDMIGAFVDPFDVPQMSVAMATYPAALPKRLYPNGLGRNMTMYIVMKKYDMTLRQYLKEQNPDIRTRCLLLTQLLEGIVHLGNHGIAHRDIKSDNLFLDISDNGVPHLVIGDFGCCLADTEFGQRLPYFTADVDRGGNCSLMAPEISTASAGRDVWLDFSKADLWAVGTIIYELFSDENPFYMSQRGQPQLDSRTYKECDLPLLPETVPDVVRILARACLSRNPSLRPFPVDAANLMQMYLWFPDWFNNRPSLVDVKEFLLILTARLVLLGRSLEELSQEDVLRWTFLHRLNINELTKIFS